MNDSTTDALLKDFSGGFAFDERLRQQLDYDQMNALANVFPGLALGKEVNPERSAWLTGLAEGSLAEAELLGPDWNPPEPEKLSLIGFLARHANGDPVRPEQTPRGTR